MDSVLQKQGEADAKTGQGDCARFSMNNKIKVIKRRAYGYRDNDYFFLKIKAALPGKVR